MWIPTTRVKTVRPVDDHFSTGIARAPACTIQDGEEGDSLLRTRSHSIDLSGSKIRPARTKPAFPSRRRSTERGEKKTRFPGSNREGKAKTKKKTRQRHVPSARIHEVSLFLWTLGSTQKTQSAVFDERIVADPKNAIARATLPRGPRCCRRCEHRSIVSRPRDLPHTHRDRGTGTPLPRGSGIRTPLVSPSPFDVRWNPTVRKGTEERGVPIPWKTSFRSFSFCPRSDLPFTFLSSSFQVPFTFLSRSFQVVRVPKRGGQRPSLDRKGNENEGKPTSIGRARFKTLPSSRYVFDLERFRTRILCLLTLRLRNQEREEIVLVLRSLFGFGSDVRLRAPFDR